MYEAKVIADSICNGSRLTTMQLTHPRCVHSEFNTHCMFARNASSSRAIPFKTQLQRVIDDPFTPRTWGKNQPGMQAQNELSPYEQEQAQALWLEARDKVIKIAREMADPATLNVHKQDVNRLLEPWMWITLCVTGDAGAWSNYFALRCHEDADPKLADQAYLAQKAYFESYPKELGIGDWHLPYTQDKDWFEVDIVGMVSVSVARCARVSYLTQEGTRSILEDIRMFTRLHDRYPKHASPFEHACVAMGDGKRYAKYVGWRSRRFGIADEYITDFKPNYQEHFQKLTCQS